MSVISLSAAQAAEHGKQVGYPAVMFKGKLYTSYSLLGKNISADADNQATALKERLMAAGRPDLEALNQAEYDFPKYGKDWPNAAALHAARRKKAKAKGMGPGEQQWKLSNL